MKPLYGWEPGSDPRHVDEWTDREDVARRFVRSVLTLRRMSWASAPCSGCRQVLIHLPEPAQN